MDKKYQEGLAEEREKLQKTIKALKEELELERNHLLQRKEKLVASRRDMWENTVHFTKDFSRLTEVNQELAEVSTQTAAYANTDKRIKNYERMVDSPYFGRFDFLEEGESEREKIYVGRFNLMDSRTGEIHVYDWRAPISGIFYRYERGQAAYKAPSGDISGEVLLKRQYKIRKSRLEYFFDCSIRINDDILQEVLSRNASVKMRNIVETIQKEQDMIIRDRDNDLLIVQGVAGSGKTSIALHRVAYLLYEGMGSKLGPNNILIISPNALFSKYISSVLPELGEENVEQVTFDELFCNYFEAGVEPETRNTQLEAFVSCGEDLERKRMKESMEFKGSNTFITILDRLLWHFEHKLLAFEDVYFDGKLVESRQQLKNKFLNNKIGMPMARRLKRIESQILESLQAVKKARLEKITRIVAKKSEHQFEVKTFSRLLSIKEARAFSERLHRFTEIDCFKLYKRIFNEPGLFGRLSKGLKLPEEVERIRTDTGERLEKGRLAYEDAVPLLYLKLKMEGNSLFSGIRHVVVDEVQDYYPIHFQVLKHIFKDAGFTVLGDIRQAIEKDADMGIYDGVAQILEKKKTVKVFLNKSYRASYEINAFAQKLLKVPQDILSFERHEKEPCMTCCSTGEQLERTLEGDIGDFLEQGFETVAILCKTQKQAEALHSRLKKDLNIKILHQGSSDYEKGVLILPAYMAKGLEFDVVLVYGADKNSYSNELDRKLLYIAGTRALHRLGFYYTGDKSPLLS